MKAEASTHPHLHQSNHSKEWETDSWGPKSVKQGVEVGLRTSMDLAMGKNGGSGVGVENGNGVGGSGLKGDGTWMRGSLWKGYQVNRGAEERRAAAL